MARELEVGRYCSLRTTGEEGNPRRISPFSFVMIPPADPGSGLVVVSFDTGGELAKLFADAWFEKADASLRKRSSQGEQLIRNLKEHRKSSLARWIASPPLRHYGFVTAFCADRAWRNTAAKSLISSRSAAGRRAERMLKHDRVERFALIAFQLTNEMQCPEVVRFFDGAD